MNKGSLEKAKPTFSEHFQDSCNKNKRKHVTEILKINVLMCAPFVGRFNFQYLFCGRGTQQAEQPFGVAAQLAEKRWLAYMPALVPCHTLFLTCLCLLKQSVLNRLPCHPERSEGSFSRTCDRKTRQRCFASLNMTRQEDATHDITQNTH